MIGHLLELLFKPPPIPPIELPLPARVVPGIRTTIEKAFVLAYHRGVYDGFVAGVLIALLFVPSIRGRVIKGAGNVLDQL
jgi:hypothetical protein